MIPAFSPHVLVFTRGGPDLSTNHERRAPPWFPHKMQLFPSLIILPRRDLVGRYFIFLEHLLRSEFTRVRFYPRYHCQTTQYHGTLAVRTP